MCVWIVYMNLSYWCTRYSKSRKKSKIDIPNVEWIRFDCVRIFLGFYFERIIECAFMRIQRTKIDRKKTEREKSTREWGSEADRAKIVRFNFIRFKWLFHRKCLRFHCVCSCTVQCTHTHIHGVFLCLGVALQMYDFRRLQCFNLWYVCVFERHKLLPLSDAKWNVQFQQSFQIFIRNPFGAWHLTTNIQRRIPTEI